jgi:hypothetical protein
MNIRALRILPPLAIGRLGSAPEALDNFVVEVDPEHPLDFRTIKGAETLVVDDASGQIVESKVPDAVTFSHGDRIRPVAPFLEVFALTDEDDTLRPLTLNLLKAVGLGAADVSWRVTFANRKVVRRTADPDDLVAGETAWFSDHAKKSLYGYCRNFIAAEKYVDFGQVRYIAPTDAFPEIRLRFTPATGLIYGPDVEDAFIDPARRIYDHTKRWYHFEVPVAIDDADPDYTGPFVNETLPASLFAIVPPAPPWLYGNVAVSRGYLDDACDGIAEVAVTLTGGTRLTAVGRFVAGPPAIVPDSLFVRTLADDLDQIIHGPTIPANEPTAVTRARAEDIVRRAYETVRFLNVAVMNGNTVKGRPPLLIDTMPAEEAFDTERLERPVMPEETVDTLAILALHQQVFAALRGGSAPWFARLLRKPEEAADYTDHGRRKMPALMCGADNNYLALTHRQIDTIRVAALGPPFEPPFDAATGTSSAKTAPGLTPRNLSAQLHYQAKGNPHSSRPIVAIGNCTPGLEVDFRAVWRRILQGLVLREYDNLVVDVDPEQDDPAKLALKGHRLLRIAGVRVMTQKLGPSPADPNDSVVLATDDNPDAVQPMEWSNALAHVLHEHVGRRVTCDFSADVSWFAQPWWPDPDDGPPPPHVSFDFTMLPVFEEDTAVISRVLAEPGELTQGLCSPWQNDYRECSCYYWASARPDFVNLEASPTGGAVGDNWLQKKRTGDYVPDDYQDSRLVMYDDLFANWEKWLRFQIRGRDIPDQGGAPT